RSTLSPFYAALKTEITPIVAQLAKIDSTILQAEGCSPQTYYCLSSSQSYAMALSDRVGKDLAVSDFWGNLFTVSTAQNYAGGPPRTGAGPDEKAGNADDDAINIDFGELGLGNAFPSFGGPQAGAADGAFQPGAPGAGGSTAALPQVLGAGGA